ncbi:FAD-binding protein [Pararhodobacter sp.]|uniref:FAD-dependent oxidoreductase n=1 Tax=Pararhodobacter sp. TaxID=2127056 RepID=UPI002AFE5391|nr:FAD-binding protein [Pararhodobacter sp.]
MAGFSGTEAPGDKPGADFTCDVLVVGTGPGGMAATAAAAATGASVHVIEALDAIGGNAVWSTGYMAFVGSRAQAEAGIRDSAEAFLADAQHSISLLGDRYPMIADPVLMRLFAEHSAATYDDLIARGVRFSRFIPRPLQHRTDRMLAVEDMMAFRRAFEPDFARPNVTLHLNTSARRLVTEGGSVTGLIAEDATGQTRHWKARKGVVLATGGFQANPELRARHVPGYLARAPYLGVDTCRGDGHLMAGAVGADLINMAQVLPLVIVSSSLVEDCIAVTREGRRFHDEAGPYERRVEALQAQPGREAWYIIDGETLRRKAQLVAQMPRPGVSAPDLATLASRIGADPAGLAASVAGWNAFLAGTGAKDPDFGRVILPEGRRPISKRPFHALPMVVGSNFVAGGLRVTAAMQAVDVFGAAIPGLYAAGDAVGGLNPTAELGGMRLCGGFTLGRIAGTSAAHGRSAPVEGPRLQGAHLPGMVGTRVALQNIPGDGSQ